MKKIINAILCILAVAAFSCKPVERNTEDLENLVEERGTLTIAASHYYGDAYGNGNEVYTYQFLSEGMKIGYDQEQAETNYYGSGYILGFDLIAKATTESIPGPAAGSYSISLADLHDSLTIENAYCIIVNTKASASTAKKIDLVDGSIVLTKSADSIMNFTFEAETILGTELEASYQGKIFVGDPLYLGESDDAGELEFVTDEMTFAVEDYDSYGFSIAELVLIGDDAYVYMEELAGPVYGEDKPKKPAPGTYTMAPWTYAASTFTPGEIYGGVPSGTYVRTLIDREALVFDKIWYAVMGQMTVTQDAENYTIEIELISAMGTSISVTYQEVL